MDHQVPTPGARRSARVPARLLIVIIGALALPLLAWSTHASKRSATKAEATIRHNLDESGLQWAQVSIEKGKALITGRVPSSGMGSRALTVARTSQCRGFFGETPCVRAVTANFGMTVRQDEAWPELTARIDNGVVMLLGTVPDQASRNTVLEAARSALSSPLVDRVVDDLTVSGDGSPPGLSPLLKRVTKAVTLCNSGQASVADGRTQLRCDVAPSLADSVRYLLATPLPTGVLDVIELTSPLDDRTPGVTSQDARGL